MNSKDNRSGNRGFTLAELLVVIAILVVLVSIAVPIFEAQLEKARNRVDMSNARLIADAITYYYMANPAALKDLQTVCDADGSKHCVQVEVMSNTTVSPVLRQALFDAGLIKDLDPAPGKRFYEIVCKSKTNWGGYRVVVSNYNAGHPGEMQIRFWGLAPSVTVHSENSWGQYDGTHIDATGFKDAMERS